jgi:type VI secretion system protein ImpK
MVARTQVLQPIAQPRSEVLQTGRLARILQEVFTVVVRVRTNRQSAQDAATFRAHLKRLLSSADQDAKAQGYSSPTVRNAIYALVAFVDEAVLNSNQPMFREWPRQPLQEEIFGDHMAGETFFRTLDELQAQPDSSELADLLEVYHLCLLLGFRGRMGVGGEGEVFRLTSTLQERIQRIRGGPPPLAPSAGLPRGDRVPSGRDPWIRPLLAACLVLALLAIGGYLVFRGWLGGAATLTGAMSLPLCRPFGLGANASRVWGFAPNGEERRGE